MLCPYCKTKPSSEDKRYYPFCSERCKAIDLGKWATGEYRVAGNKTDESEAQADKNSSNEDNED